MLDGHKTEDFVIGIKQSRRLIESGEIKKCYVAKDVNPFIIDPFIEMCNQNGVEIIYVDSKKELGKKCGIDVDASVAALK